MATTVYPDAYYLRQVINYTPKTGAYRWAKFRPRWHFADNASWLRWNKLFAGKIVGSPQNRGIHLEGVNLSRGHIAWIIVTGRRSPMVIDHINGDQFDNRWANLREVTVAQNIHNRIGQSRNGKVRDLPKGVFRSTSSNRFFSNIMVDGKNHYLGSFATPEEAHKAYCEAGRHLHGKFFEGRNTR